MFPECDSEKPVTANLLICSLSTNLTLRSPSFPIHRGSYPRRIHYIGSQCLAIQEDDQIRLRASQFVGVIVGGNCGYDLQQEKYQDQGLN
jgi:hypothetical protein